MDDGGQAERVIDGAQVLVLMTKQGDGVVARYYVPPPAVLAMLMPGFGEPVAEHLLADEDMAWHAGQGRTGVVMWRDGYGPGVDG